jgi:CheY-like chemotaxis protein
VTARLPAPILLADDSTDDLLLLRRAFRLAVPGWPIHVAEDGETAIAYLGAIGPYGDRNRYPMPALLLLDLKMPRRSGFEVLAWVRCQPGLRRLPVVVLTSSRDPTDIGKAYDLGVNAYVVKPGHADELAQLARTLSEFWLRFSEWPSLTDTANGPG